MTSAELANDLTFEVRDRSSITANRWREVVGLCVAAFEQDFDSAFRQITGTTHVLAYRCGTLVSHSCWVVRWLQPENKDPLETAYVEAVATPLEYRHNGYATEVMRRLAVEIKDFELAALSTGIPSFYERLGWEQWRGPLAIRIDDGLQPTPRYNAMVLRLPMTPKLDLNSTLTAEWREGELW